ncbi:5-oxoprolinase subunit PxpB [Algoriphagus sp. H41]|uniref:5-oxoprolinase subunit PxpB n=1 Tax=Algoriphagus oliviformis TaxID=2811231 RepID=A0ABS3C7N2_9BACT|nr:5-oxoprolinase subunit PxpB [Algoriphagus oliviformis]MBN7813128.1 5-oxoprolinase subunit PxpB [Algoriphagus oliviformis]
MKPIYLSISPTLGELHWDGAPDDALLASQLAWMEMIQAEYSQQLLEVRQGFTALSIRWKRSDSQLLLQSELSKHQPPPKELPSRIWEVPVCYDPHNGRDLADLALRHRMSINQLIELHSAQTYRLHFFGFLPGFMYLNGLPPQLHTPRKAIPDRKVEAGSVAIGGGQTGIYPQESPGGWHLIGRTPLQPFDPRRNPPVWATPGDRIKFEPIDRETLEVHLQNPPIPKAK